MDSLLILIPVALVFVAIAVRAFIWAVNNRQYDDLDAAANSILFDDAKVDPTVHHAGTDKTEDCPLTSDRGGND